VFGFLADQRGNRSVVRLADRESGLSARTIARRLSSVSGLYAYLIARGDTPVQASPVPRGLSTRRQGGSRKSRMVPLVRVPRTLPRILQPEEVDGWSPRCERPGGRPSLEYVRSIELLDRLLPPPPTRLLDVGGGPGTYAAPLARRGYRVHLVDPVPLHVQQAREAAGDGAGGFTAALGDARELPQPDESQDAVCCSGRCTT